MNPIRSMRLRTLVLAWLLASSPLIADGPCNVVPTAQNDTAPVLARVPVVLDPLANDFDPDGQPLTVTVTQNGCPGQLDAPADGTLVYTSAPGFLGNCSIVYDATDSEDASDSATIALTVSEGLIFADGFESGDTSGWSEVGDEEGS